MGLEGRFGIQRVLAHGMAIQKSPLWRIVQISLALNIPGSVRQPETELSFTSQHRWF